MSRMFLSAANSMSQLQVQLDTIGNNVANIDTTGFKKKNVTFQEALVQQFRTPEQDKGNRLTPPDLRNGVGTRVGGISTDFGVGASKSTGRPLDVALTNPNQFFEIVQEVNGELKTSFTRDGNFQLAQTTTPGISVLTTQQGHPVVDKNGGPILIPSTATDVKIDSQGNVVISNGDGSKTATPMSIVQVNQTNLLENLGGNLYQLQEGADTLEQVDNPSLVVGALESSNVKMEQEMTSLISTQRSYQMAGRALSMADQMSGLVNTMRTF